MSAENRRILKEIGAFSLPAVAEQLLLTVISLAGTVFVGRLGTSELAAVSVAGSVLEILLSLFMGLGLGATIHIAREADEENGAEKVRELTAHTLFLSAVLALLVGGGCFAAAESLLKVLFHNLTDETKAFAVRYLRLCLLVSVPTALDVAVSSCLRGVKDSRTPFVFTALANVLNIALCLLFIYGLNMGIDGAAYAYMISKLLSGLVKTILLYSGRIRIALKGLYRLKTAICRKIMRVALPSMAGSLTINLAFLGVQVVTAMIGDAVLAGYQVSNNMLRLVYAVTGAMESADVTLTGNALGMGNREGARRSARLILYTGELVTAAMGVVMFALARPWAMIFTKDEVVIGYACRVLRIMVFTIPLTTGYQCTQGALKTGGMNGIVVLLSAVSPWCVRLPLAYVAVKVWGLGIYGLILGNFADYTVRCVVELVLLYREKWLYKSL